MKSYNYVCCQKSTCYLIWHNIGIFIPRYGPSSSSTFIRFSLTRILANTSCLRNTISASAVQCTSPLPCNCNRNDMSEKESDLNNCLWQKIFEVDVLLLLSGFDFLRWILLVTLSLSYRNLMRSASAKETEVAFASPCFLEKCRPRNRFWFAFPQMEQYTCSRLGGFFDLFSVQACSIF